MKNLSVILASIFLFGSLSSQAITGNAIVSNTSTTASTNVSFGASMHKNMRGEIALAVKNDDDQKLKLDIRSTKGYKVFSETIRENSVLKRYDVSELPAGTYTLELRKGNEVFTREINIK